jgi:hypothetical protein
MASNFIVPSTPSAVRLHRLTVQTWCAQDFRLQITVVSAHLVTRGFLRRVVSTANSQVWTQRFSGACIGQRSCARSLSANAVLLRKAPSKPEDGHVHDLLQVHCKHLYFGIMTSREFSFGGIDFAQAAFITQSATP